MQAPINYGYLNQDEIQDLLNRFVLRSFSRMLGKKNSSVNWLIKNYAEYPHANKEAIVFAQVVQYPDETFTIYININSKFDSWRLMRTGIRGAKIQGSWEEHPAEPHYMRRERMSLKDVDKLQSHLKTLHLELILHTAPIPLEKNENLFVFFFATPTKDAKDVKQKADAVKPPYAFNEYLKDNSKFLTFLSLYTC